jgi:CDGSH-type Zn-finger protein
MARLVRVEATGPVKIEPGTIPHDKPLWICACGLSQRLPYCDGSHKITRSEQPGMVYIYTRDGKAVAEVRSEPPDPPPSPASAVPPTSG